MPPDPEEVSAGVFAALADPTRRAILASLAERGPSTATDLSGRLSITRQGIAKHLGLLAEAGLVTSDAGRREAGALPAPLGVDQGRAVLPGRARR